MIYMLRSYSAFRILSVIFIILLGTGITGKAGPVFSGLNGFVILPGDANDESDLKWAEYLLGQSENRLDDKSLVSGRGIAKDNIMTVYLHIDKDSDYDYSVFTSDRNEMFLYASSDRHMLWLIYQWIAKVAETDKRWRADDLDPSIVTFDNEKAKFDFGYRSIYSSSMADPDRIAINADMHVDYDWGLWGHNLRKVFADSGIPEDAMALVDGKRNKEQFCFSSEKLYDAISCYIVDSYGYGDDGNKGWFAIMPDDNMLACMCEKCRKKGNTPTSASPSVASLIRRLASDFPFHMFYASAYNTTREIPAVKFPENAGVIISAIDLPLDASADLSLKYAKWSGNIKEWSKVTDKVIVWDYMKNFDDYLTPFPCLSAVRNRLQFYRRIGVYGVFFNGSGDDFSTFDDLQTYVISSLMKDSGLDIYSLIEKYLQKYYPSCSEIIYEYYSSLERKISGKGKLLDFYSGIDYALDTFLDAADFVSFYYELDKVSKNTDGMERKRLNSLLTALNFTQLEIIRSGRADQAETKRYKEYISLLEGATAFDNMKNFRETGGSISAYIKNWHDLMFYRNDEDNIIAGKEIGGDMTLTDGYFGFPNDYHLHWKIYSGREIEWAVKVDGDSKLSVELSFLHAPGWKISAPSKVEIFRNGKLAGEWYHKNDEYGSSSVVKAVIDLPSDKSDSFLDIKITGNGTFKIACDELSVYKEKH